MIASGIAQESISDSSESEDYEDSRQVLLAGGSSTSSGIGFSRKGIIRPSGRIASVESSSDSSSCSDSDEEPAAPSIPISRGKELHSVMSYGNNASCETKELSSIPNSTTKSMSDLVDMNENSCQAESDDEPELLQLKPNLSERSLDNLTSFGKKNAIPNHPNLIGTSGDSKRPTVASASSNHPRSLPDKGTTNRTSFLSHPTQMNTNQSSSREKDLLMWRRRLWPSLAPFYRVLLRCSCKYTPPAEKKDENNNMDRGELSLEWGSFWKSSALSSLPVRFKSVSEHNRQMFLLLLEECRASMSTIVTKQSSGYLFALNGPKSCQNPSNLDLIWQRGEVKKITTSRSNTSSDSTENDPRLGSIWIVEIQIFPSKRSRSDSDASSVGGYSKKPKKENLNSGHAHASEAQTNIKSNRYENSNGGSVSAEGYRPGELLACRSPAWGNRLALGVVQGYDPDYDMLLSSCNDESQLTCIQLLICVDDSGSTCSMTTPTEPSGWVDKAVMPLCVGSFLSLTVIGNIVTNLRECQAISSVASLRPSLRDLILCSSSTAVSSSVGHDKTEDDSRSALRPDGVSLKLWSALCKTYNDSQLMAIAAAANVPQKLAKASESCQRSKDDAAPSFPLLLVQGPPGTGKTSTVMGMIAILLDVGVPSDSPAPQGKKISVGSSLSHSTQASPKPQNQGNKARILLCAPSNTAVDEMVYRLKKYGILGSEGVYKKKFLVVRIGQPLASTRAVSTTEGMSVDVRDYTLDYLVEKKRREYEASNKRSLSKQWVPNTIQLRREVLLEADVVCSTLSGSGSPPILDSIMNQGSSDGKIPPFQFDAVVIDEAAQAVEPSSLIPLKYNPRLLIMVGDACQLRATVLSKLSTSFNYGQSLFERFASAGHRMRMLLTQYRMHPDIAEFPSKRFYGGKLKNDVSMIPSGNKKNGMGSRWRPYHDDRSRRLRPMVFHNIRHGHEEVRGTSYANKAEAEYVLDLYGLLRKYYSSSVSGGVGIITAYNAQRRLLISLFKQRFGDRNRHKDSTGCDVEIATVDGFQGREKDVIIFSCVRSSLQHSNGKGRSEQPTRTNIGFMNDSQRLNVAITRAKFGLWIVGNATTMSNAGHQGNQVWRDLIDHCRMRGFIYEPY